MKLSLSRLLVFVALMAAAFAHAAAPDLDQVWNNPPQQARLRAYWWWLNGNVTKESITHDLEQMKAKGFAGAILCDADGSSQDGNARAPHGPTFFTPEWRELYKHTLREADRLGLEISLNMQSGWNLGGPMVTPGDAPKKLVWTELHVTGATNVEARLARPQSRDDYYRDLFVLAYRVNPKLPPGRKPIQNLAQKALVRALEPFSAPVSTPLFEEVPATPGEQDTTVADVVDITKNLAPDGTLRWQAPAGDWQLIRFGCTLNDHCRVSTCSEGWDGYALDPFDANAFKKYWNAVVEPLIADAEDVAHAASQASSSSARATADTSHPASLPAHMALRYLHTDSWEVEVANWTPTLRDEFKSRRGYDLLPWLPVITGKIVNTREESDRFLNDFRKTMGDLAIDNHYKLFKEGAHKHGLQIHPESGGPHAVPIDAQRCLGWDDAPMSEFWAWSWTHRIGDENRFFVKQPASAAHTYGHNLVLAEGFTTIGPHWQETLWDNLKPSFDKALCEGLNVLVWHAFVCSPKEMGIPGQQYFAGTHLNPEVTWWAKSAPFFSYINRCQALLQRGNFVADVAYYYGDHVPNFAQLKKSDPTHILPGYDYDVITEEALLTRATVRDGNITLPDGMNYRVLVLPDRTAISEPVLRKLQELVKAGATIIGPKPEKAETLRDFPKCDKEVARLANTLWKGKTGKGRVLAGVSARELLARDGIQPDCDFASPSTQFDYIHRRDGNAEIYFVANRTNQTVSTVVNFRVTGKAPELWNPVTGERRFAAAYEDDGARIHVPLEFTPCGSWLVIFRDAAAKHAATATSNAPVTLPLAEVSGPWTVHFDTNWGGPASAQFDQLVSWTTRPEPGIKYFSGTAVYEKTFVWKNTETPNPNLKLLLDLGNVRELAEVRVNGKPCGITWAPPFRVDVTDALRAGENKLEIEVVNFWPNRIIGDANLPQEQRLTQTNIRKLTRDTRLTESGLLGPVRLLATAP